jgi:hypothetical protein
LTETGRYRDAARNLLAAHEALNVSVGREHEQTQLARKRLSELDRRWRDPKFSVEIKAVTRS